MTTVMEAGRRDAEFYFDATNELEVAKFPEDFADWLMDNGREQEAREFLNRWHRFVEERDGWGVTLDDAQSLADDYATVIEINEEVGDPVVDEPSRTYREAFQLLRDADRTTEPDGEEDPLPWDREAALVNMSLKDMPAEPIDWDEHEYDDVIVYVDEGDRIPDIIANTITALIKSGYQYGARTLAHELEMLLRFPATNEEMFALLWSYVDIQPTARRRAIAMLSE